MTGVSIPRTEESLAEAGERIRAACPVQGATATDEECHNRRDLVAATLAARGVTTRAHVWHTAQLIDGRVVGVSAGSVEEAEIDLTIWWELRCHWVIADPESPHLSHVLPARETIRRPRGPPVRPRSPSSTP